MKNYCLMVDLCYNKWYILLCKLTYYLICNSFCVNRLKVNYKCELRQALCFKLRI